MFHYAHHQQQDRTSWSSSLAGDGPVQDLAEPPLPTDDGDQGPGTPGDAAGARVQGTKNVATKIKDALI